MTDLMLEQVTTGTTGGYKINATVEDGREVKREVSVRVAPDYDAESPREWDNLGTLVCWHRSYNLGDENIDGYAVDEFLSGLACNLDARTEDRLWHWEDGQGWAQLLNSTGDPVKASNEMQAKIVDEVLDANVVLLPVYIYDHSGITISTGPFNCPWDSGQVGFIYTDRETILKEHGRQRLTQKLRRKVAEVLKGEIKDLDAHLTGNVWWVSVEVDGEILDSCGGIIDDYGLPYCLELVNNALRDFDVEVELP